MRLGYLSDRSAVIVIRKIFALRCRSLGVAGATALSLISLVPWQPATAATFPELYTVTVEANPQDCAAREGELAREGMALLLIRLSGRRLSAADSEASSLIGSAPRYLASCGAPSGRDVRVGFNATDVNRALTDLNWPIWNAERPAILLWLAAEFDDGQRAELRADPARAFGWRAAGTASDRLPMEAEQRFRSVTDEILEAADQRGLPIVLPVLDAEDRSLVRFADVWGGFDEFVLRAAERYAVDAVLIGRLVAADERIEIDWSLHRGQLDLDFRTIEARAGIDWVADQFAAEMSTVGGARVTFIHVRSIEHYRDFGRVIEYLESVSIIEAVDVASQRDDELVLRVIARGDDSQLARILTLDGQLVRPDESSPPDGRFSPVDSLTMPDRELVFVPAWLADLGPILRP